MERLVICRICLNANGSHLIPEMQLQEMYKKLTSMSFQNISKPSLVCYLCHAKLYKAHRLMLQCLKAEEFLMHMFNQLLASNDQVQQESIDLDGTKVTPLICTAVQHIDIEPQTDIKERTHIMYEEDDMDIKIEVESGEDIPEPGDDLYQAPELSDVYNEQTCIDSKIDIPLYYIKETSERITDDENVTRVEKKELIGWTKGAPVIKNPTPDTQNNKNEVNKYEDDTDFIKRAVTHDLELTKSKCNIETKATISCEGIADKEINNKQDVVDISVNDYCLWSDSLGLQHNGEYVIDTLIVDESNTINKAKNSKKIINSMISNKTVNNTTITEISFLNVTSDYQHDKESDIDDLEQCKTSQNNYRDCKNIKKGNNFNTHSENEAQLICNICRRSFDYNSEVLSHVHLHCGGLPYICKICDKGFTQKCNLKRHEQLHNGNRSYKCKICDKSFTQMGALKSHQRIHPGERPYSCKICDKSFTEMGTLKSHQRIHTGERLYICKICDERFTERSSLKRHAHVHTAEKRHSCKICDKRFVEMGALKSHERGHTDKPKPYICKICDKRFKEINYLRDHLRIHSGERPYSCKICDKRFPALNSLRRHERVHTGWRPYSCKICNKIFTETDSLKMHERIHTGERPYSCKICDKRFIVMSGLRTHERIHTGERPYSCKTCDKSFTHKQHLQSHIHDKTNDRP